MLTQQIISLVFLLLLLSHECTAQNKFPVQQNILLRRNHIIRCCGKKSCSPVEKFVSIELPTTTTQLTTTTEGITTTTLPPTTTEPITVEFTTEVVKITETVTQAAVIPVTVFSPSTRSSTPRVTTIAAVSIPMKPTDPRVITLKYVTVPTKETIIATTPYADTCQVCILDSCRLEIAELANAIALGKNGNIPGPFNPITIGVKKYHFAKGHYLRMIQALIFCRQHGYDLAQIESIEEHEILQAQIEKLGMKGNYVYAGGHKIGNCSYRWLDGRKFNVNFWQPGNPVEGLYENCIIFLLGKIFDVGCQYDKEFVCEALE